MGGVANHSDAIVDLCKRERPDALLLDVELNGARAVDVTRAVMRDAPCPVLLVSSGSADRLSDVYEAMGGGAVDVVSVPGDGALPTAAGALVLQKLATISKLVGSQTRRSQELTLRPTVLAIGASTGGPHAIAEVLSALPRHSRFAIVVVQHVDGQFAEGLANWLQRQTGWPHGARAPGHPAQAWPRAACRNQ